jgi:hypothetical protein
MIATLIVGIAIATGITLRAQDGINAHVVRVQAESVQYNCSVNGVVYPVDYANNIWAINPANGLWSIIGHLYATPNGFVAVTSLGVRYSAVCQ